MTASYILGPGGEQLEQAPEVCDQIRDRADELLDEARKCIRRNPVPIVLGALGVGIALGCLIACNRSAPSLQDRASDALADAGDAILGSARNLFDNLKFW